MTRVLGHKASLGLQVIEKEIQPQDQPLKVTVNMQRCMNYIGGFMQSK